MAEEVEMTPVEMTPVDATEPPKVNPLVKPAVSSPTGLKLPPTGLKTGLKLPPRPGATVTALRPGLKLPPKPGATATGLKLPPKPGATVSGLKTGLSLPPKPGATAIAKPLIRKPGEDSAAATSLPKPLPKPVVPVDAQGVAKLPTVEAKAMSRDDAATPVEIPKPLDTLKSVTQKLKGLTQQIPPQAILHKTGIIAETSAQTDAQKEAAKHKTARISLSDAMGVAPVKDEPAPMKTIRIKRPVNLPGVSAPTASASAPAQDDVTQATTSAVTSPTIPAAADPAAPSVSVTQRKTLKISRPGTAVRPTGKFGVKKPVSQATTVAKVPVDGAQPAPEGEVADIPDLPPVAEMPVPQPAVEAKPGVGTTLAVIVQLAACVAVAALVWFFYENSQLPTYCGGLGWGQ